MKIDREYSDKEEDFQKAVKVLVVYVMKRLNSDNKLKAKIEGTEKNSTKPKT